MARVTSEIRKISPERPVICDGLGCGHMACPELLDLNVILSGRGYTPIQMTHYKAEWMIENGSDKWDKPVWPGMEVDGVKWGREALKDFYKPWKELKDAGAQVHIGECGCYNKVDNKTALAWYEDFFSVCSELGFGWALWNFRGPFGIAEHRSEGTRWEVRHGIAFDRDLYELFTSCLQS